MTTKIQIAFFAVAIHFFSCQKAEKPPVVEKNPSDPKAQAVVDAAIKAHGGDLFDHSQISFDFRDRHYISTRNNGMFTYERIFQDSTGAKVHDVLTNEGFTRRINGELVDLPEERKKAFTGSVNSVIYFALLPYFLNDAAAVKTYLGEVTIAGEPYDKVLVTFAPEGGGEDHEDVYVYWFHRDRHTMDYFGYSFGGNAWGARLRKVVSVQEVGGIRFSDYLNLSPIDTTVRDVTKLDSVFENNGMKSFSEIKNENIQVEPLKL